jgi:hypothetical protein
MIGPDTRGAIPMMFARTWPSRVQGSAAEIFTPKIDRVFVGLEQYRLAQSYMEMPDRKGKVVISLR